MALFEEHTHAFIVRIWLEPRESDGDTANDQRPGVSLSSEWRGVIEHVTTHEKRFVRDLDAIATFLRIYLERMGVDVGTRWWEEMNTLLDDDDVDDHRSKTS